MKKAKKLLICLTAAALVCSACAVSACGSKDSDIVTDEEWEAAFAIENFYNVTIEYEATITSSSSSSDFSSSSSEISTSTKKIALVDGGEYDYGDGTVMDIVIGNIYSEYSSTWNYTDASLEDENNTSTSGNTGYSLYGSDFCNTASKSYIGSDEGAWSSHSFNYPAGVSLYTLIEDCVQFSNTEYFVNYSREYIDGAYVVTRPNSSTGIYDETYLLESGIEYEFSGGDQLTYIKFNDGKLTSLTQTYSCTVSRADSVETYSETKEYTFINYGKTSVTVPDEVTALFS